MDGTKLDQRLLLVAAEKSLPQHQPEVPRERLVLPRVVVDPLPQAPCTTPECTRPLPYVDLRRLELNINAHIMADQYQSEAKLTPRDLYVKSNPGLLGSSPDLTDPRQWYSSQAARKLIKDFERKYKAQFEKKNGHEAANEHLAFLLTLPDINGNTDDNEGARNDVTTSRPREEEPQMKGQKSSQLPVIEINPTSDGLCPRVENGASASLNQEDNPQASPKPEVCDSKITEAVEATSSGDQGPRADNQLPPLVQNEVACQQKEDKKPVTQKDLVMRDFPKDFSRTREEIQSWLHRISGQTRTYSASVSKTSEESPRKGPSHIYVERIHPYADRFMELRLPTKDLEDANLQKFRDTYELRQKSLLQLKLSKGTPKRKDQRPSHVLQRSFVGSASTSISDYGSYQERYAEFSSPEQLRVPKSTPSNMEATLNGLSKTQPLALDGQPCTPLTSANVAKQRASSKKKESELINSTLVEEDDNQDGVGSKVGGQGTGTAELMDSPRGKTQRVSAAPSVVNLVLERGHSARSSQAPRTSTDNLLDLDPLDFPNLMMDSKEKFGSLSSDTWNNLSSGYGDSEQDKASSRVPSGYRPYYRKFNKLAPFPERYRRNTSHAGRIGYEKIGMKTNLPTNREPTYKLDTKQMPPKGKGGTQEAAMITPRYDGRSMVTLNRQMSTITIGSAGQSDPVIPLHMRERDHLHGQKTHEAIEQEYTQHWLHQGGPSLTPVGRSQGPRLRGNNNASVMEADYLRLYADEDVFIQ